MAKRIDFRSPVMFRIFKAQIWFLLLMLSLVPVAQAAVFGRIQGIVHDPQHRPIRGAQVTIKAAHSALEFKSVTNADGEFNVISVPIGEYLITASDPGFASTQEALTLASDTSPMLHFQLQIGSVQQTISVSAAANTANVNTVTPTVLIDRETIAATPGADRTNSLAMITDFVPGAYVTHDMLHMRGGHQVSFLIDGVEIPNTNIASNLGAQIDPKDIDYIEVQRGSYTADVGDRTYGVFNVVPRTGFERDREAELVVSAGNFLQTNDQLNLGDHSEKAAYYASVTGDRSDYGLSPPVGRVLHDAANGFGGFASLLYNRTPKDQFRLVTQARDDFFQIPYDPNPASFGNQQFDSSGLRDVQHEHDALAAFTWLHTFSASTVLQLSPFFHENAANYDPNVNDTPVATTSHRTSNYAGAQGSVTTEIARNTIQAGFYSFGQHDSYLFGAIFNDGSGNPNFSIPDGAAGGVVEEFVSDNYKATDWLTVIAGLRQTHFQGAFSENYTAPRVGLAVRVPKLNWVFRGFYGRFYQPPPLLTATGPVVQFAQANNTSFTPLHGERDEEHQFGVQIPYRGWLLDADTFKTRVNNFLDHSNIGDSSIYYPVTVDGALIRAWELTLRSPQLWRFGQAHLAYSNQIAEQRGNITGGLICVPVGDPACDAGFNYTPVDHDQRNTLNVGFNATLPKQFTAATNVYYGSGFVNGDPDPTTPYPNAYLPQHTTFDLSVGKSFSERVSASVTATNVANRRLLLDNSLTFGGFHYNDPREIYAEVRYRFHY
jgi:hypothetical protein